LIFFLLRILTINILLLYYRQFYLFFYFEMKCVMSNKYPKYRCPEKIALKNRKWPDKVLSSAPVWCSVDLRDGNQSLPIPMGPQQKLEYFRLLTRIGFKEIEVGFPSASQDDFNFVRELIEGNHIPDDVRISVLTQSRKHLIERTIESLEGVKQAILHCYLATSDLHGQIVFGKNRDEVKKMSFDATKIISKSIANAGMSGSIAYEFSPEEFTDSDIDYVIDICTGIKEIWGKSTKRDLIFNLPATVERRPPYQYADMIEYFCTKYPYLSETSVSLHAHNDQGCAVAATEMALMAGADRVEGTIFGHGERTGNLDICIFALNLYSRGIETGLDFSNMPEIVDLIERVSGIPVHPRHPYAGQLVFTAFSGSHQDAIRKGMESKEKASKLFKQGWKVPYLHIDPADIGRSYEKLIRINSQSGKGGAAYVLEHDFGIYPPKGMHPEIGSIVQAVADEKGTEINSAELLEIFRNNFINAQGPYSLVKFSRVAEDSDNETVTVKLSVKMEDKLLELKGKGNGPISAVVQAIHKSRSFIEFILDDFSEQTLGHSADAKAMAYVGIRRTSDNRMFYGAGEHSNIDMAAILAVFAALNRAVLN